MDLYNIISTKSRVCRQGAARTATMLGAEYTGNQWWSGAATPHPAQCGDTFMNTRHRGFMAQSDCGDWPYYLL